jgi:DnaJ-class molecular chaperone
VQRGVSAAALKKRYRELAVLLHPDKCRMEGAKEAFQRVTQAYQHLLRFVT